MCRCTTVHSPRILAPAPRGRLEMLVSPGAAATAMAHGEVSEHVQRIEDQSNVMLHPPQIISDRLL